MSIPTRDFQSDLVNQCVLNKEISTSLTSASCYSGSDLSSSSASVRGSLQPPILSGSLVLTDQEDLMSVTTSESKNLLAECEAVPGPDIIPQPKHRRKVIAIPVESEATGQQAYRELSYEAVDVGKRKISAPGQGKLSPPTPFADSPHQPVDCCFTKLKAGEAPGVCCVSEVMSDVIKTLP